MTFCLYYRDKEDSFGLKNREQEQGLIKLRNLVSSVVYPVVHNRTNRALHRHNPDSTICGVVLIGFKTLRLRIRMFLLYNLAVDTQLSILY